MFRSKVSYNALLDKARYEPVPVHFLECLIYEGKEPSLKKGRLKPEAIDDWLSDTTHLEDVTATVPPTGGFRLLLVKNPRENKVVKTSHLGLLIPFTRTTYDKLMKTFHLPKEWLSLAANNNCGVFAKFRHTDHRAVTGNGYAIQSPNEGLNHSGEIFTLLLFHDTTTNITTGITHSWENDIENWDSWRKLATFITLIENSPAVASNPTILATWYLTASHAFTQKTIDVLPDQKIWESSSEKIGMIYALSRTSYLINTIQASVTFNRHLCDQLQQELSAVAKKCDHELYLDTKEDLRAISFMIDGVNSKISQARERSAALNSSFYNTISQIDNQLNYQIAKATRMDSYDMRAIALLTTFFLPGTFVAAFFSSGVFTFESSDSSIVQKTPMWIYWAITIPLTFVVVTSWMFWSKNHKKRDKDEAFGAKETDNRGKGGGNDASGGTGGQRGGDGGDGSGNGNGTGSGANANAAGWRSRVRARFKARGTQGQGGIDLDMYTTV